MIQKASEGQERLEQEAQESLARMLKYARSHGVWGKLTVTMTVENGRITLVETSVFETKK